MFTEHRRGLCSRARPRAMCTGGLCHSRLGCCGRHDTRVPWQIGISLPPRPCHKRNVFWRCLFAAARRGKLAWHNGRPSPRGGERRSWVAEGLLSILRKPTVPCVLGGVAVVRAVGELTNQDSLLFYGAAWVAQLSQR